MTNSAVVVNDLRVKRGGRDVLKGITCEIPRGTVTGLLGPSGCGKTTLMRSLVGVQIVEGGEITVLGRPAGHKDLRSRIGYATQNPAVYPDITVTEALTYFASVLRAPADDVARVINEVDLTSHADAIIGQLSGGQLSRANLAVALLGSPELLILDEPTVGLDPVLRDELWELFTGLAERGVTLLVSSHVMDEASRCAHLLLLREGELLAAHSPAELRENTGEADLERAFLRLIKDTVR
ncbi:ABC transporter ATP-binding protein [Haloechinothrix halophila]|uniref:ABC transporter ATP-binding protein n=1 Tax=Haloechinothrix halophila TaxID=1069073 RepID=UPI000557E6E7|nr:ABC transporter ATP-binding protein [Haloechinothrix halophila]